MRASQTYATVERFYIWQAMFDCIGALTTDCLACQNMEPKPKHLNEVPLEELVCYAAPFCATHIDYKGPLHPLSNRNTHCLLIVTSILRSLIVYPVNITDAHTNIAPVEKWIVHFGIAQSILLDRGTAFLKRDTVNWTKELGITLRTRTTHPPGTDGKMETHYQHIARYRRSFLDDAGTNWAPLAPKFAFAQSTSANYTSGKTPQEVVRGAEPQIPMSVKLGFYCNKQKLCCSELCSELPPHTLNENSMKNELFHNLRRPHIS